MQHDHPFRESEHCVQIVFDHQQGAVGASRFDQRQHVPGLLSVHSGGGLVQQQQGRIAGQRQAQFQRPQAGVVEGARRQVRHCGQSQRVEPLTGVLLQCAVLRHVAHQTADIAQDQAAAQVVRRRQRAEHLRRLEAARQPQPGDARRGEPVDAPSRQPDAACGGPQQAADELEQGGFARAVRPDQRQPLAALHLQRHVRHDRLTTEHATHSAQIE
ncbi:hypothetical protein GALL_535580 [mine drainage metagenome]|uniref:Uncharacterized protein n=1 Tax=mine drainage metagenome TaxID=410659 RepID=A0A1J5PHY8_9ZZZZ